MYKFLRIAVFLLVFLIVSCDDGSTNNDVTYHANGADSGTVPASQTVSPGTVITAADNTGDLAKDGFSFNGWNTAENGAGTAVAVGASYTVTGDVTFYAQWKSDTEPKTWTKVTLTSGLTVNKVSYGKGIFVATGYDSSAAWSEDGIAWHSLTEPEAFKNTGDNNKTQSMHHYFGGDRFVASAGSAQQKAWAVSSDGKTWTPATTGSGDITDNFNAKGGVSGNGYYCISGSSGRIAYTKTPDDSQSWEILQREVTTFTAGGPGSFINAMAFGNGVFVAGGGSGHIAWVKASPEDQWEGSKSTKGDGKVETIFDDGFINSIAYGNGFFVAVGGQDSGPGKAAWSPDGKNWTFSEDLPIARNAKVTGVAFGAGVFVLADNKGDAAYSTDFGKTWNQIEDTTFNAGTVAIESVGYGAGKFILAGGQGQIAYSIPE